MVLYLLLLPRGSGPVIELGHSGRKAPTELHTDKSPIKQQSWTQHPRSESDPPDLGPGGTLKYPPTRTHSADYIAALNGATSRGGHIPQIT